MVWFKHKLSGTKRKAIELESDPKCGVLNMELILNSQVPFISSTTFLTQAPTHNKHSNEKSNNSMDSQVVVHVSLEIQGQNPLPSFKHLTNHSSIATTNDH
jgi:hypothetical protein